MAEEKSTAMPDSSGGDLTSPISAYSLWPTTPKSTVQSPRSIHKPAAARLSTDRPPAVPEKDYAPSSSASSIRPMTKSTNRLSFSTMNSMRKRHIKFGTGKHAKVELIPQPSDDPDDPLNWPRWRKDLNVVSLLMVVGLIGGMKTAFVTTNGVMTADFRVSYTAVAALTAVPLMLSSFTGTLCLIASKFVGKRPLYLGSFLFIFIGSIWNMTAHENYGSCMGARVFQGLGWGAFDTLVIGSIQDTYFEHERALRISIYNIFTIAATWGSPIVGGLASERADSFTVQFRIINTFFLAAIPLLVFGAPETAFDRVRAITPVDDPEPARPWLLRQRVNKTNLLHDFQNLKPYLEMARPYAFRSSITLPKALEAPRAMIAPTTWLVFLLSVIPYGTLWSLAGTIGLLVTPMPLMLGPATIGTLMVGPWLIATIVVAVFCFLRRYNEGFTQRVNIITLAAGTTVVVIGVATFGMTIYNAMTRGIDGTSWLVNPDAGSELSLPVLSFLVGLLAAGVYITDATTRPLIARSASFTSSSMPVAQRTVGDMHAGVVVLRNLTAGIFILALPNAVSSFAGLRATVIGLSCAQVAVVLCIAAAWWFYEECIWRVDGKIMGLVDLSILKKSHSFFETD
ncbi:hypothetical protein NLU13_0821 [Sarocladium strictum]|uniref:Major facilitator superfamily transporter n=1 Tax=Sarocladium strictum TaxID=5046 RepID=A0AA39GPS0_SARSR|nr:hypothetical protein NLU13_0821 [Sarocladium strictum]